MNQKKSPTQPSQSAATATGKRSQVKQFDEAQHTPTYTQEEEDELKELTALCEEEMRRIMAEHPQCVSTFNGNELDSINLKALREEGVEFYTLKMNRIHGVDEKKTGESIMSHGAQQHLLVITVKMAQKLGIEVSRFANDPDADKAIKEDGLVFLDGNGRINYLLAIPVDSWPPIFANLPQRNRLCYYDIRATFSEINVNVAKWKTQDYVMKVQMEEGDKTHEGWKLIYDLTQKGYNYQAACQLVTLGKDRVKKSEIFGGKKATEIFKYIEEAKPILKKLQDRFGEGDDKTIKTKALSNATSSWWGQLRDISGTKQATSTMLDFLDSLSDKDIDTIKQMKKSGDVTKDQGRIRLLTERYNAFQDKKAQSNNNSNNNEHE